MSSFEFLCWSFGPIIVSQLFGEKWRALSAEDKVPFEAQAAADKARYLAEMEDYVPPSEDELARDKKPSKPKRAKKKKDPNAPKRPLTACTDDLPDCSLFFFTHHLLKRAGFVSVVFAYAGSVRPAVKKDHPEAGLAEMGSVRSSCSSDSVQCG